MREVTFLACSVLPTEHGTSDQEIAAFSASACCALFSNMQPPRKTANHRSAEKLDKLLKTIGGIVCEANAPLADRNKIQRMAPADFMGRYMPEWFDYAITDEVHQLAGDTAQGHALGVLARVARKVAGLTGTLLNGYAGDLYNTLFRVDANRMVRDGFTWGSAGKERFTHEFGVIETIERTKIEDNACSRKNKTEVTIRRKPGASPLLFGKYLMDTCAFVSLEDISDALPAYREDVVSVELAGKLKDAYQQLQDDITATPLQEHRGNRSVLSTMLNALLRV